LRFVNGVVPDDVEIHANVTPRKRDNLPGAVPVNGFCSGLVSGGSVMEDINSGEGPSHGEPRWQPLDGIERRVAGVLVEKAKTTPDGYPMSLKAVCTAANQKSNRYPVMHLEPDDVEEALERLRQKGAVGMIEGYGRVTKYRHYLYDWLGVDKVELAVMAELLLRGAQTQGELRGRASRMEPIADLSALSPVLASLKAKGLVIPLTPEGRGHVITHALYLPRELENLRAEYAGGGHPAAPPHAAEPAAHVAGQAIPPAAPPARAPAPAAELAVVEDLRREVHDLRDQVAQLRSDFDEMADQLSRIDDAVRELKDALGA